MASYSDDFNRPNQTLETSANWERRGAGGLQIYNSHATDAGDLGHKLYVWASPTASADHWVECELSSSSYASHQGFGAVRVPETGNGGYFFTLYDDGFSVDWWLLKYDPASGPTALTSGPASGYGAGDVVRIEAEGTSIRVRHNGVVVIDHVDSTFQDGRRVGLGAYSSLYTDNWSGGDLSDGGGGSGGDGGGANQLSAVMLASNW